MTVMRNVLFRFTDFVVSLLYVCMLLLLGNGSIFFKIFFFIFVEQDIENGEIALLISPIQFA